MPGSFTTQQNRESVAFVTHWSISQITGIVCVCRLLIYVYCFVSTVARLRLRLWYACVCGIVYLRAWIKLGAPAVCMYIFPTGPRLASSGKEAAARNEWSTESLADYRNSQAHEYCNGLRSWGPDVAKPSPQGIGSTACIVSDFPIQLVRSFVRSSHKPQHQSALWNFLLLNRRWLGIPFSLRAWKGCLRTEILQLSARQFLGIASKHKHFIEISTSIFP